MKTLDLTEGKKPNLNENEEYRLTVEFHNGDKYCYYGKTKKEAESKFKKAFGSYRGFISKEWSIG